MLVFAILKICGGAAALNSGLVHMACYRCGMERRFRIQFHADDCAYFAAIHLNGNSKGHYLKKWSCQFLMLIHHRYDRRCEDYPH